LLGSYVFGGPLRVLFINAEDGMSEVALRFRAAMQHHGLADGDVPGLHVAGADTLGITLLRPDGAVARRNEAGWTALTTELDLIRPDVLVLDTLVSLMGGASVNDNAAAAILMGGLVALAAERRIGIIVAHHASKGRDPMSAESAMGAASFVNLARIALGIEPLAEKDAPQVGCPLGRPDRYSALSALNRTYVPLMTRIGGSGSRASRCKMPSPRSTRQVTVSVSWKSLNRGHRVPLSRRC
jgi:hypothetical protein